MRPGNREHVITPGKRQYWCNYNRDELPVEGIDITVDYNLSPPSPQGSGSFNALFFEIELNGLIQLYAIATLEISWLEWLKGTQKLSRKDTLILLKANYDTIINLQQRHP